MCGCDGTQYALACTMHRIPCIVFHLMFMCGCRVVERSAPRPHRHWAWFMSQKYLSCKHNNTFHVKAQKYISCKHKSEYKTSKLITNQTSIGWVGVLWHFCKAGMVIWKQNLTNTVSTYLVLINNCLTYWFIFIKNQSSGIWRRLNQKWFFALAQTNWQQWLVCKFTLQLWMHNESGGMQAMEIFHTMWKVSIPSGKCSGNVKSFWKVLFFHGSQWLGSFDCINQSAGACNVFFGWILDLRCIDLCQDSELAIFIVVVGMVKWKW